LKLVLDTNAWCLCDTGNEPALEALEEADPIFLPVIVYGELYYGFRHGTRFEENRRRLDRFIDDFGVIVISVDIDVAKRFGDIFADLRNKGRPIPTNDIWISACCMSVGGTLLTADRHFTEVSQIDVRLIGETKEK